MLRTAARPAYRRMVAAGVKRTGGGSISLVYTGTKRGREYSTDNLNAERGKVLVCFALLILRLSSLLLWLLRTLPFLTWWW